MTRVLPAELTGHEATCRDESAQQFGALYANDALRDDVTRDALWTHNVVSFVENLEIITCDNITGVQILNKTTTKYL